MDQEKCHFKQITIASAIAILWNGGAVHVYNSVYNDYTVFFITDFLPISVLDKINTAQAEIVLEEKLKGSVLCWWVDLG